MPNDVYLCSIINWEEPPECLLTEDSWVIVATVLV